MGLASVSGFGFCLFLGDGSVVIDSLVVCALIVLVGGCCDWSLLCIT